MVKINNQHHRRHFLHDFIHWWNKTDKMIVLWIQNTKKKNNNLKSQVFQRFEFFFRIYTLYLSTNRVVWNTHTHTSTLPPIHTSYHQIILFLIVTFSSSQWEYGIVFFFFVCILYVYVSITPSKFFLLFHIKSMLLRVLYDSNKNGREKKFPFGVG